MHETLDTIYFRHALMQCSTSFRDGPQENSQEQLPTPRNIAVALGVPNARITRHVFLRTSEFYAAELYEEGLRAKIWKFYTIAHVAGMLGGGLVGYVLDRVISGNRQREADIPQIPFPLRNVFAL